MTIQNKILSVLDAAIGAPAKPATATAEKLPSAYVSPSWAVVKQLLVFAKLPTSATRTKLDNLALAWQAEISALDGLSHADAILKFRNDFNKAVAADKTDLAERPTKKELIQRNADRRAVIKARAGKISQAAGQLAAEVLTLAKVSLPAFRESLLAQEKAIFAHDDLGKSPLIAICDALPKTLDAHIEKLKFTTMSNPATLLK